MKRVSFFLVYSFLTFSCSAIELGGLVTSDLTLYATDNPHNVISVLSVPIGVTITITEGVELYFDNETYLEVAGTIVAIGTLENEVLFTRQSNEDLWGGIVLYPPAVDYDSQLGSGCKFEYCRIEQVGFVENAGGVLYTGWGIASDNTHYYVDHCSVFQAAFFAVNCGATIKNSILEGSGFSALCPTQSMSNFEGNEVFNSGGLLTIVEIPGGNIINNNFHDNHSPIAVVNISNSSATVSGNSFTNNSSVALAITGGQNHDVLDNVFSSNDVNFWMYCEREMEFLGNCFLSYNDWNIILDGGLNQEEFPIGGCNCSNLTQAANIDLTGNTFAGLTDAQIEASIKDADDDISLGEPFTAIYNPQASSVNCITSVQTFDEFSTMESVLVYPNPCDEFLYLSKGLILGEFTVYNGFGEIVKSGRVQSSIAVDELPNGHYYLRTGSKIQNFVVLHK